MSATKAAAGAVAWDGDADCRRALQAFDDTKAGVKGLVDGGITAVPAIFHHPPDSLHATSSAPSSTTGDAASTIPVIDLSAAAARREEVVARVKAAAETVGFFQVVNHGVAGEVAAVMLAAVRRFNEAPAEARRPHYTRDIARKVRYNSNFDLFQSTAANWRDTLFCDLVPEPPEALRCRLDAAVPASLDQCSVITGVSCRIQLAVLKKYPVVLY